jgi:hypothetical protein
MEGTGRAAAKTRSALANATARSNRDGIIIEEYGKSMTRRSKGVQKARWTTGRDDGGLSQHFHMMIITDFSSK